MGDRLIRPRRKARKAADVLTEATSLSVGDLVVHADHGIGRFQGLTTITALGAPHDCLLLIVCRRRQALSAGREHRTPVALRRRRRGDSQLDRLGGVAWQSRKARLKKRLKEIAAELIKIAALRQLKEAPADLAAGGRLRRVRRALSL